MRTSGGERDRDELARLLKEAGSAFDPEGVAALLDGVLAAPVGVGTSWHALVADPMTPTLAGKLDALQAEKAQTYHNGLAPEDFDRLPRAGRLERLRQKLASQQLDGFLGAHQVKAIIVDSSAPGRWPDILAEAGLTADATGGVLFYKVPAQVLIAFHSATAHQMAEKEAAASFAALVTAARKLTGTRPVAARPTGRRSAHSRQRNAPQEIDSSGPNRRRA